MSSDRLPSFKGPRDLSLSARGAKRDGAAGPSSAAAAQRPRRVFTPNIPPKRERGSGPASASAGPSSSGPKEVVEGSSNSRGRPGRGRGAPRGGARGAKQRAELLQSESIFADGIGERSATQQRTAALSYRSGYGGGRYKGGEGGPSRMSSMNRATLNTLIKEEDGESNKKIFGTEKFERDEDEEANADNPNTPIVLPLLAYVPDTYLEPTLATVQSSSLPGPSASGNEVGSLQVATPTPVRVKEEKPDDDDELLSVVKVKEEKDDDSEAHARLGIEALAAMTLDTASFAGTLRSNPPEGTLVYFQLPDELPILEGSIRESVDQQDTGKNGADLVKDINDLPEGFVGRIQILSSGRTRFILGDNSFDVDPGRTVGFRQELCAIDLESKTIKNLGPLNRKFVITPDIESLIRDAL